MYTLRAILCLGLFGWLGYEVWTEQFTTGYTAKSRALGGIVSSVTERYGTEATSILLFSTGIILAFFFMILQSRHARA